MLIVKPAFNNLILRVVNAIIHGLKSILFKQNFSGLCTPPNFDDCISCDTSNTHRNDYSSINKTCPCEEEHYYDSGDLICFPCHKSWLIVFLEINFILV